MVCKIMYKYTYIVMLVYSVLVVPECEDTSRESGVHDLSGQRLKQEVGGWV